MVWSVSEETKRCGEDAYSNLEQKNGTENDPFARVESVQSAVNELECTAREKVGTCIPSHVVDRVEVVGDLWNGRP